MNRFFASVLAAAIALASCARGGQDLLTAPVARQTVEQTVSASGTLAAQDTILVGSQVSGTIQNIYVDYNSRVRRGQVLARLDPSTFQAALDQARATLAQLQAQSEAASATTASAQYSSSAAAQNASAQRAQIGAADEAVHKAQAAFDVSSLTLSRDRALLRQGYVAQNVVDNDVSVVAATYAALVAARSQAAGARITTDASTSQAGSSAYAARAAQSQASATTQAVRAAEAAVRTAEINLQHATIVSPVDGTVIARNVSVGQTVAAALQAPTLFTIAKDLRKMELDIAVGEPDVGGVRTGQRVTFTVLAHPGRVFEAAIFEVRQNPTVVNNVTTYDAVAYPANPDGALRPGMNATARIVVATYPDALVVPLAALQWQPSANVRKRYAISLAAPDDGDASRSIWQNSVSQTQYAVVAGGTGRAYVVQGQTLNGVTLKILAIDGARVAASPQAGKLAPGDSVVIDESTGPATPSSP